MGGRIRKMLCMGIMGVMGVMMLAANVGQCQDKKEGWANVPGGQVWLEPGRQAYEHDTGLVRDLVTGLKSRPITPQSVAQQNAPCFNCPNNVPLAVNPVYPLNPYPAPYPSPYPQPYPITVQPVPPTYVPRPWFDLGPNSVYLPSLYNSNARGGYGVKLGSTGSINQQWKQTRLPK